MAQPGNSKLKEYKAGSFVTGRHALQKRFAFQSSKYLAVAVYLVPFAAPFQRVRWYLSNLQLPNSIIYYGCDLCGRILGSDLTNFHYLNSASCERINKIDRLSAISGLFTAVTIAASSLSCQGTRARDPITA